LFLYVGFFHHRHKLVGAVGNDVVVDSKPDITFAFGVGFDQGIAGEGIREDVAGNEEFVEPSPALEGVHCRTDELNPRAFVNCGLLLSDSDGLALGRIAH